MTTGPTPHDPPQPATPDTATARPGDDPTPITPPGDPPTTTPARPRRAAGAHRKKTARRPGRHRAARPVEPGSPSDRAYHLARVCAGFTYTISPESAVRLARLLRGDNDGHDKHGPAPNDPR